MRYLLFILFLSLAGSSYAQNENDIDWRYQHYGKTQFRNNSRIVGYDSVRIDSILVDSVMVDTLIWAIQPRKVFAEPDTLVKCRIGVLNYNTTTADFTKRVINGYCLCERPEQGFILPPFGINGWGALLMYGDVYRIVRVKEYYDKNKAVVPPTLFWDFKFYNWN